MYRGEVFRSTLASDVAYRRYRSERLDRRLLGMVAPPVVKAQYLKRLQTLAPPDAPVIGFRLMYDQLRRNPSLAALLPAFGIRVIHLVRENLLETVVSVAAARESGLYVTRSTVKKTPAIRVDVEHLVAELERRHRLVARHRALLRAVPSLEFAYEQYVADPSAEDARIMALVGLEPVELGSRVQRTGARSVRDRISNIDEVESALASTRFARFLDS